MKTFSDVLASPIGPLQITVDAAGRLCRIDLRPGPTGTDGSEDAPTRCAEAGRQLDEYFRGARREFELELALAGTPFQLRVWAELSRIPYGTTISYKGLAARIGKPAATRAVGAANGANPIPIVVPCHRVISAGGGLGGYGGGLAMKRALLAIEGAKVVPGRQALLTDVEADG